MTSLRIFCCFMLFVILLGCGQMTASAAADPAASRIEYHIKWLDNGDESLLQSMENDSEGWKSVSSHTAPPQRLADQNQFLLRIVLPKMANGSGILFDNLTGLRFKLMQHDVVLYDFVAVGLYPYHRILVPLHAADSEQTLYLYGKTTNDSVDIGIGQAPLVGSYEELSSRYTRADLPSMALGLALIFVAIVMLVCSIFLSRDQLSNWLSLSIIVMTIGILIVLCCPFPYLFFSDYAAIYGMLSDAAIYVCLPLSVYFFEQLLVSRWRLIVRYWRYMVTMLSVVSLAVSFANEWADGRMVQAYAILTGKVLEVMIVLSLVVIVAHCLRSALERNKEAFIICIGIVVALAVAALLMCWLYNETGPNRFYLWELPLTGLIFHLIVLLSKRYVNEHAQAAAYLRELEIYQKQLKESTQREAASRLAASVAHEVRNPLSVTRGFVQLLRHRNESEAEPLQEALEELDHAHDVITNYLKYAKPEADSIDLLNIQQLLKETVMILNPLLLAHHLAIDCHSEEELYIRGRASQLKQALITILKQRVQSLTGPSRMKLSACVEDGHAVIRIADEGKPFITSSFMMPAVPLANDMTDAGLIFALRSIEALNGKLSVKKRRGGSEITIRLPAARAM